MDAIELSSDSNSNDSTSNQSENIKSLSLSSSETQKRNIAVKRTSKSTNAPPASSESAGSLVSSSSQKARRDITNLKIECMKNFNPFDSARERNKRKQYTVNPSKKINLSLYDETGKIRNTTSDICDCFDSTCVGCFFPCKKCGSEKCAIHCRVNRKWAYDLIEYDGKDFQKKNPLTLIKNN
jgi:hypothetical protein